MTEGANHDFDLGAWIDERVGRAVERRLAEVWPGRESLPAVTEGLVTLREAAAHLSVTERHLRNLVAAGEVPHYKPGGVLRFKLSELDTWAKVDPRRLKAVG